MPPKSQKPRRIFMFASYNLRGISTRYRAYYVLKELENKQEVNTTFIYPGYGIKDILIFLLGFSSALFSDSRDRIIIQKVHSSGIYAFMLKLLVRLYPNKCIYDIDDADYLRYDDRQIQFFMRNCGLCIVGSEDLKNYVEQRNKHVSIVSSAVLPHNHRQQGKSDTLHLGWVGHYGTAEGKAGRFSHRHSLKELLFPALLNLNIPIRLSLLGVTQQEDKGEILQLFEGKSNIQIDIPLEIDWQNEDEVYRRISLFDVGLSPMLDNEFNRSKSAFKLKQYLSCGVPSLASPVGENKRFLRDGENGYFCSNAQDFEARILEFHSISGECYQRFSNNCFLNLQSFSMASYGEKLMAAIDFIPSAATAKSRS